MTNQWTLAAAAIQHYQSVGYRYIDVPWVVSRSAVAATYSGDGWAGLLPDTVLVGSAEQSVIQLLMDGKLEAGSYVSCTPCFREDQPDELHQSAFLKVELSVITKYPQAADVDRVVADAAEFFSAATGHRPSQVRMADSTIDLEYGGIEIGSYGIRSGNWNGHGLVYGTGLAMPRLHSAIARLPLVGQSHLGEGTADSGD